MSVITTAKHLAELIVRANAKNPRFAERFHPEVLVAIRAHEDALGREACDDDPEPETLSRLCPTCEGRGECLPGWKCKVCNGTGWEDL